jgi:hypothetical protein
MLIARKSEVSEPVGVKSKRTKIDLDFFSQHDTILTSTTKHGDNMLYKGSFIARIPNDDQAPRKIAEFKEQHGQLRLCGRHKDRKGTMLAHGLRQNNHRDIPHRLAQEIVIYRNENGMTFKQFQSLQVGDLVQPYHPAYQSKFGKLGVVVAKRGKNELKVSFPNLTHWTTRQQVTLINREQQ